MKRRLVRLALLGPLMYVVMLAVQAVLPHLSLPVYVVDVEDLPSGSEVLAMGLGLLWVLDGIGRGVHTVRSIVTGRGRCRAVAPADDYQFWTGSRPDPAVTAARAA